MKASEHISMNLRTRGSALRALRGFSFVEILVAAAISALTIAVGALAYSAIVNRTPGMGTLTNVNLPANILANFYGVSNTVISVGVAPAYGELARAEIMRETLDDDLRRSVMTVCLARNGVSTFRPTNISLGVNFDPRSRITPAQFRNMLSAAEGASFVDYFGAASTLANVSLFILEPSTNITVAKVRAIYESDILQVSDEPAGIYASVRRYSEGLLTDYYHVFYPDVQANTFLPPVVFFERTLVTAATAPARFRQAPHVPFYFLWWPDPANPAMFDANGVTPENNSSQPRSGYWQMANKTSYFFVIPSLPPL